MVEYDFRKAYDTKARIAIIAMKQDATYLSKTEMFVNYKAFHQ